MTYIQGQCDALLSEFDTITKNSESISQRCEAFKIESNDDLVEAQKLLKEVNAHRNLILAKLAPINTAYKQSYERLNKLFNRIKAPMIELEETLISWMAKQKAGES